AGRGLGRGQGRAVRVDEEEQGDGGGHHRPVSRPGSRGAGGFHDATSVGPAREGEVPTFWSAARNRRFGWFFFAAGPCGAGRKKDPKRRFLAALQNGSYGRGPVGRNSSFTLAGATSGAAPASHVGIGFLPSSYSDSIGPQTSSTRSVNRSPISRS